MTRWEFTSSIISEIELEWMQVKKQHMLSDDDRIFGLTTTRQKFKTIGSL